MARAGRGLLLWIGWLVLVSPLIAAEVEVLFTANEGVLIRAGDEAVLIDSHLAEPYSLYGALPAPLLAKLEAAAPPFDTVDLVLASHVHRDHFQGPPAKAFLAARPQALLASSPQVLEALGEPPPGEGRLRSVLPQPGESETLRRGGIEVEFLRLSHGSGRHARIQNLGHIIRIGGVKILHIGDAFDDPANFAPYGLAERDLDLVLVPYWFYWSASGQECLRRHLHAKAVAAVHIPPQELDGVRAELAKRFPEVQVPGRALEPIRLTAASAAEPQN
ncbi:MAG: MBL fold metallo-hydrolase [Acidobacteriota bacterium]